MVTSCAGVRKASLCRKATAHRTFVLSAKERKFVLISLGTLLAVRLLAMFWLPFMDTTEARYAEIARIMVETGDWITPQFQYDVPFWGKPPLHTWLSALGMELFGVGPFGARVFILASAICVLGLVYAWVGSQKGADQALVTVMVLASSIMFLGASAFVMTDMVMTLGTTLSMVAFFNCLCGDGSATRWGRLFFLGVAIGLLAKGPVALVITLIPVFPWLIATGRWRDLRSVPWKSGLLITVLLTLPWYIAAELKTPGFLRYFIVGEHFERFVVPGWQSLYGSGHEEPLGTIWLFGLAVFLPWTLFALALIPRAGALMLDMPRDGQGWHSYLLLWTISPLLLFTPAHNILAAYALPGLPAAAILLVSVWAHLHGAPGWKTRAAATAAIATVTAIFFGITAMAWFAPDTLRRQSERELVASAQSIDPDIMFTYWGGRSFSADFYTRARVQYTVETATLEALSSNHLHDAVAVPVTIVNDLIPYLGSGFDRIAQYGDRVLFIERYAF